MILFGPSGLSDSQIEKKIKYVDLPKVLADNNLKAFEYAFTMGVRMSDTTAELYGNIFKENNIKLSVHAPYYINFASSDPLQIEKSHMYITTSLEKMKILGADRLVFHPGSLTKQSRETALSNTLKNLKDLVSIIKEKGLDDMYICPETMGKHGQIGSVDEVYEMCKIDDIIIPTLDFGHINSFTGGSLKTKQDFKNVLDKFILDLNKKEIHIHFSKIEYGQKGEKKHLTLEDTVFGPDHEVFLDALKDYKNVNIRVICESKGTQLEDSLQMYDYFKNIKA